MRKLNLSFLNDPFSLYYITDSEEAKTVVSKLQLSPKKVFGLDIETGKAKGYETYENEKKGNKILGPRPGLDPRLSEIRLMQFYDGQNVYVFDCFALGTRFIFPLLRAKQFVAHNGVFEIKHLAYNGCFDVKVHCSMLMSMLVDRAETSPYVPEEDADEDEEEESPGYEYKKMKGYSLDAMMAKLFNVRMDKHFQTSNWNARELEKEQICYAGYDAIATYKIAHAMRPKLKQYDMMPIYTVLRKMQHVIAEMEYNGFRLNPSIHQELIEKWKVRESAARVETEKYFEGVNLNSPKQMGEWLEKKYADKPHILRAWPKSPSSKPDKVKYSFNKNKIAIYVKNPPIAAYIAYKKISKLLSTYGETMLKERHPITGCLHSSYSLETRTGRSSSSNPNLQNIPRVEKKDTGLQLRHCFTAGKDMRFVVGDYSQIEMRVMAELSRDPTMLEAFRTGTDLHKLIVSRVLGKHIEKVTDDERQLGKAINFGFAFGMGAKKFQSYAQISYGVSISEDQAWDAYNSYHQDLYPVYSQWCERQRARFRRDGFSRTPLGKIRKLHKDEAYTRSVNTPVQGGAAEVIYKAAIRLLEKLRFDPFLGRLINIVHDEIIIRTSVLSIHTATEVLRDCMAKGYLDVFPNGCVRDIAEIHAGKNWHDAKTGKVSILQEAL